MVRHRGRRHRADASRHGRVLRRTRTQSIVARILLAFAIVVPVSAVWAAPPPPAVAATVCAPGDIMVNTASNQLVTYSDTGSVLLTLPTARAYGDIALSSDGVDLYGVQATTLYRINPATGAELSSIAISGQAAIDGVPWFNSLTFRDATTAYIGSPGTHRIYIIDLSTGSTTYYGGSFPVGEVASGDFLTLPDGDLLALGGVGTTTLYRISPSFVVTGVGTVPETFGAAQQGGKIVLAGSDGVLRQLDTVPTVASTATLTTTTIATSPSSLWGATSVQDAGLCGGLDVVRTVTATTDLDGDGVLGLGDEIQTTTTVTNSGTLAVVGVDVVDSLGPVTCTPALPASLAVGASLNCVSVTTIAIADLAVGSVSGISNATATTSNGFDLDQDSNPTSTPVQPGPPPITAPADGSTISTDTPVVEGTGVPTAIVTVTAGADLVCSATVAGDGSWSCTSTIAFPDGPLTLIATQAVGSGPDSPASTSNVTIGVPSTPLQVTRSVTGTTDVDGDGVLSVGDRITTETIVENVGFLPLSNVTAVDSLGTVTCLPAIPVATLAIGASMTCSSETTITLSDVVAGAVSGTSTANGETPSGVPVSGASAPTSTPVGPNAPAIVSPLDGAVFTTGNITISGTGLPGATVTLVSGATVLCTTSVAVDGSWSCVPADELPDGGHTLSATQAFPATATSPADTASITVARPAPPPAPVAALASTGTDVRLVVGALLALVAGALLVASRRRDRDSGRYGSARHRAITNAA